MNETHYTMQNRGILQSIPIFHNGQNIHPNIVYIHVHEGAQLNLLGDLNVEKVEHIETINTYNNSSHPKDQTKQEPDRNKQAELAVHQQGLCSPAEWAVVVKLLEEQGAIPKSAYLNAATYINDICGQEVTNARAIARSIIFTKVSGSYPDWRIKDEEQTRETPNKLSMFNKIAQVFIAEQNA